MDEEFRDTIRNEAGTYGIEISEEQGEALARHYELVGKANEFLHLTGPCSASEFARRHTLESLVLTRYLPDNAAFIDIGTGGGFPAIPCLIVRPDLRAILIESKEKKAQFLGEAARDLGIGARARIIARQFEEAGDPNAAYITSRALDRFSAKVPRILKRFKGAKFRFFGGPNLEEVIARTGRAFDRALMPGSDNRYLFVERG